MLRRILDLITDYYRRISVLKLRLSYHRREPAAK